MKNRQSISGTKRDTVSLKGDIMPNELPGTANPESCLNCSEMSIYEFTDFIVGLNFVAILISYN